MDKAYLLDVATKRVAIIWERAQKAYPKQLLNVSPPATLINTRLKTTAGYARYIEHRVEFSAELMWEHTEHFVQDTIPHEVAHILTHIIFPNAKQHHGPEWRNMLRWLRNGKEPMRFHTLVNSVHCARRAEIKL